ncbi:MAG: ATP-binding cassette domain-containing protein [Gammaproteobacteria bacterium]|nr:ATP-binding cassette domain-containing protein [Gammaproteobacteria bacterium]
MIEITHLKKLFGELVAVDDISFKVVPGEILGFLGPNGAGKSTTMKVITGFLSPSSGSVSIWGSDIETDTLAAQKHIGYLPEGAPCYEEMTPRSFLRFIARIRGFSGDDVDTVVSRVVATLSLHSVIDQRIETLSKGFKRRVGLAQAILHDPEVLILDEPTDGLDPNQKHQVREMIRGLSKDKIVIISTHILEEVTAVCNRAVIIANGKIVADCSPEELEARSRYHQAITLNASSESDVQSIAEFLAGVQGVAEVEVDGLELIAIPQDQQNGLLAKVIEGVGSKGLAVSGLYQEKGRLDEVFRQITEEVDHV